MVTTGKGSAGWEGFGRTDDHHAVARVKGGTSLALWHESKQSVACPAWLVEEINMKLVHWFEDMGARLLWPLIHLGMGASWGLNS